MQTCFVNILQNAKCMQNISCKYFATCKISATIFCKSFATYKISANLFCKYVASCMSCLQAYFVNVLQCSVFLLQHQFANMKQFAFLQNQFANLLHVASVLQKQFVNGPFKEHANGTLCGGFLKMGPGPVFKIAKEPCVQSFTL